MHPLKKVLAGFAAFILSVCTVSAAPLNAAPANDAQRAMLTLIEHWQDTYNNHVEQMITDCYAPDADVLFTGASAKGHAQFTKLEQAI